MASSEEILKVLKDAREAIQNYDDYPFPSEKIPLEISENLYQALLESDRMAKEETHSIYGP